LSDWHNCYKEGFFRPPSCFRTCASGSLRPNAGAGKKAGGRVNMLNFGHLMAFLRKACPELAEAEWAGIHFVVISSEVEKSIKNCHCEAISSTKNSKLSTKN